MGWGGQNEKIPTSSCEDVGMTAYDGNSCRICGGKTIEDYFRVLWNIRPKNEIKAVDSKLPPLANSVKSISVEMTTTDAESMMATAVKIIRRLREMVTFPF